MTAFDRIWHAIFETDPPPVLGWVVPEDDHEEGIDPLVVTATIVDDCVPQEIARMVGQFRTELDEHDAVTASEATKLTRDFLDHQLQRLMPLPDDE